MYCGNLIDNGRMPNRLHCFFYTILYGVVTIPFSYCLQSYWNRKQSS